MSIWSTPGKLAFDALLCRSLALFKKFWRDSSGSRDKAAISSTIFVGYSSALIFLTACRKQSTIEASSSGLSFNHFGHLSGGTQAEWIRVM